MEFFETPIFTKLIQKLINDQEHHLLQLQLSVRPESGDIIKGSGGIRKSDGLDLDVERSSEATETIG